MINWRNRLTPALAAVAVLFLLVALFLRPHSLPSTAGQYKVAAPPVVAKANRKATLGTTYAIDSLESDGKQFPISGAVISATKPIIVHGWAVAPDTLAPGQILLVSLDGAPGFPDPSYGMSRPDVGAAINPAATRSGFAAVVPVAGLKPGLHSVRLTLKDAVGRPVELQTAVVFRLR